MSALETDANFEKTRELTPTVKPPGIRPWLSVEMSTFEVSRTSMRTRGRKSLAPEEGINCVDIPFGNRPSKAREDEGITTSTVLSLGLNVLEART